MESILEGKIKQQTETAWWQKQEAGWSKCPDIHDVQCEQKGSQFINFKAFSQCSISSSENPMVKEFTVTNGGV